MSRDAKDVRFVPDRMVVGPRGQPVLEPGYTEISGIRLYPDRLVVGSRGQPMLLKGRRETVDGSRRPGKIVGSDRSIVYRGR